jgi:hypothetical protein
MATVSDWSSEVPANTSVVSKFDDLYRSDKSIERNVWEEEHYWDTGSAGSTGYHKEGSFRPFVGTESAVSLSALPGKRLMFTSDTSDLYDVSSGATPKLLSRFAPAVTFDQSLDTTEVPVMLAHLAGYSGAPSLHNFARSAQLATHGGPASYVTPGQGYSLFVTPWVRYGLGVLGGTQFDETDFDGSRVALSGGSRHQLSFYTWSLSSLT